MKKVKERSNFKISNQKIRIMLLFGVACLLINVPHTVIASDVEPVLEDAIVTAEVTIRAAVPEGFTDKLPFVLENTETHIRYAYSLEPGNGYEGTVNVLSGCTYTPIVTLPGDNYKTDLADSYVINEENVELNFGVSFITYDATPEGEGVVADTHGEEVTKNMDAQEVLETYLEKVAFMRENEEYDTLFMLSSCFTYKECFLKSDPMNTEEQWEEMDGWERYNYYVTYAFPRLCLLNHEYVSENASLKDLHPNQQLLLDCEGGDTAYNAIMEVWKWLYRYWNENGIAYNFYNYYDGINAGTPTVAEKAKVEELENMNKEDQEELEEAWKEIEEEIGIEKKENVVLKAIKDHLLTIIIFIFVGIAVVIAVAYNRKKNVSDASDKTD